MACADVKGVSGEASKAWVSEPLLGKHISFDGRYLHAAPADLARPPALNPGSAVESFGSSSVRCGLIQENDEIGLAIFFQPLCSSLLACRPAELVQQPLGPTVLVRSEGISIALKMATYRPFRSFVSSSWLDCRRLRGGDLRSVTSQ